MKSFVFVLENKGVRCINVFRNLWPLVHTLYKRHPKDKRIFAYIVSLAAQGISDPVKRLNSRDQTLNEKETEALVQAMETRVESVCLGSFEPEYSEEVMTLDIGALTQYSGNGMCREVFLYGDIVTIHAEKLVTWAKRRNWKWKIVISSSSQNEARLFRGPP